MIARQRFEDALKKQGLSLESTPVNAPSEVSDAALAFCQSKIDVFCQLSDGLTNASFPAISQGVREHEDAAVLVRLGADQDRGDPVRRLRLHTTTAARWGCWPPR